MEEKNINALVNLDGKVFTNLTDKLSNAVGWVACHETPKRKAVTNYIKDIEASNLEPIVKAALITSARKNIKEYINQNDIYEMALQSLKPTANPIAIEDDWIAKFMDKAKNVSDKEFQQIWGKILARECNTPGSVPISLLYTLERMDRTDAEKFMALSSITVQIEDSYSPVIIRNRFKEYEEFNIVFDDLVNLKALGLIEMDLNVLANGYAITSLMKPLIISYFSHEYTYGNKTKVSVGNVLFTKIGEQLYKSVVPEEASGFWDKLCVPYWDSQLKEVE